MRAELLMPAGNLEKLKYALTYGADACYIGAKRYSLRAQASNFDYEDIVEACEFAHKLNKKVYVTVNVIPKNFEIDGVKDYLKDLEAANVDGIIVSSPAILKIAKDNTNLHISLSTQESVINSRSVKYFYNKGVERVVLGRENTLDEIKEIRKNTNAELEVFIHGGMCSAISGRCTLSNWLSNRDANRGGCAHSCRWTYDIFKNGNKINDKEFSIASKDLNGLPHLKDLLDIGVESLKIEGRMKSIHYVATVAHTYRMFIDDYYNNELKPLEFYEYYMDRSENRISWSGFLSGVNNETGTLFNDISNEINQTFIGIVLSYDKITKEAVVETRNNIKENSKIEVLSPNTLPFIFDVKEIYLDGEKIERSMHAMEKISFYTDVELKKNDILRKVE